MNGNTAAVVAIVVVIIVIGLLAVFWYSSNMNSTTLTPNDTFAPIPSAGEASPSPTFSPLESISPSPLFSPASSPLPTSSTSVQRY